ncbi:SpoIIE family protein phosphatase [bacterium]|nr:SpoIIE family protein phosphatase [bacterium]
MFRNVQKEQLKVPAKIEYLSELRDFVTKVGRRHGFSERVINAFKLSIDEAATNIIKHAYRDWPGNITIRAIVKANSLTIVLIDQGKYFDPRQVSDPDLKRYVEIGKKGGLGIFIMRRLLDQIDYRKTEEGNELWMIKHRDVARHPKIAVPAIPMTLKVRYWLVSMLAYSLILATIYFLNFFRRDDQVMQDYLGRAKAACSGLASDVLLTLQQPELGEDLQLLLNRDDASQLFNIVESLGRTVNKLPAEYRGFLHHALVVDRSNNIIASTDPSKRLQVYERPADAEEEESEIYSYSIPPSDRVVDIHQIVQDDKGRRLCQVHFVMNYRVISEEIQQARMKDLNMLGFIWVLGAAGLFLLIYIVMNPFRRLSEWVKALGQPGAAQEMDIDASTEIGEIAQAFSDITMKLRESQVNLAEQERLQKEMQVAQEIQQTLLPSDFPEIEGYEISSYYAAAKEVGGDYYDFVEVDKDTLGIVVADVSGKGVPGSLVMTMIRTALRTEARGIKDAAEVLSRVNDFVVNDMKKGMFVTLFYVIIDSKRRKLNYASAGHNPMILYRASKNKTFYLNPHGFPIGISLPDKNLFRNTITSDTISLAEDDILLIYTDGITEAMNRKRALFGEERFLDVIRRHGTLPPNVFVNRLHEEILSFTEGSPQNDDITLVAIKEKTTAEKIELDRAKRVFSLIEQGKTIKEACDLVGLSTYAYYNKYRDKFELTGVDSYELLGESDTLEDKHLSIEEKTKIYDIISRFPEYGAKKISEELFSERYGFLQISSSKIYEELVRAHLNTRELREAFINRGGRRRRIKPPGTPLSTLDGRVIIQRGGLSDVQEPELDEPALSAPRPAAKRRTVKSAAEPSITEPAEEKAAEPAPSIKAPVIGQRREENYVYQGRDILSIQAAELFHQAVEDLFDKRAGSQPESAAAAEEMTLELPDYAQSEDETATAEVPATGLEEDEPVALQEISAAADALEPDAEERGQAADLDLPPDHRLYEKAGRDELDFAELLQSGGGMTLEEDDALVAGQEVTDATVLYEISPDAEPSVLSLEPHLEQPIDELLEMDETQPLINPQGELDYDISEQIVRQELKERLDADQFFEFLESVSRWHGGDTENSNGESDSQVETAAAPTSAAAIEFDDLLVLLQKQRQADSTAEMLAAEQQTPRPRGSAHVEANDPRLQHAVSAYEAENYAESIRLFEEYLRFFPEDHQARMLLGNAYFRCRKLREAAQVYTAVISQDPKNPDAYENLGVVHANQGNFHHAIEVWERLLEMAPGRADIRTGIERAKRFLTESL